MGDTPEQMQEQARQMMHCRNAISRHVCMFVNDILEEQGECLTDTQRKTLCHGYQNAQHDLAMRATLDDKAAAHGGSSGTEALHLVMSRGIQVRAEDMNDQNISSRNANC